MVMLCWPGILCKAFIRACVPLRVRMLGVALRMPSTVAGGAVDRKKLRRLRDAVNDGTIDFVEEVRRMPALNQPTWTADEVDHINAEQQALYAGADRAPQRLSSHATRLPKAVWLPPGQGCPFNTMVSDAPTRIRR